MDNHCGYVLICSAFLSLVPDVVGKGGGNLLFSGVGPQRERGHGQQQWITPDRDAHHDTVPQELWVFTHQNAGIPCAKFQWPRACIPPILPAPGTGSVTRNSSRSG